MSAGGGSTKVIVIALLANLGIAIAKFFGAFFSGSSALLAEAIHSMVDTTNQVLLLVGSRASKKPPDENHPLGYGRESFFWSFVVTVLLFSLGGLFAIYEGVHKLSSPEPISKPVLALSILGISILLEGFSFFAALREIRLVNRFDNLWTWFRRTTSAGLLVIFTEDAGALVGLVIATACVTLSWTTGNPAWDAYGSIMVGGLLVILAGFLAVEIKSLIVGEAPSRNYRPGVESIVKEFIPQGRLIKLVAIQTGDHEVMMSLIISPIGVDDVGQLVGTINAIEARIQSRYPEIKWSFVEPDYE